MKLCKLTKFGVRCAAGTMTGLILSAGSVVRAAEPTTDVAIAPGADLVIVAELATMRQAPIYQRLQKFIEDRKAAQDSTALPDLDAFTQELQKRTGLTKEDVSGFILSADLENVDFGADTKPDMNTLDVALAIKLAKKLPLATLQEVIAAAAEKDGSELEIIKENVNNVETLAIRDTAGEATEGPIYLAMLADDTLLVAGTNPGIKGALTRAETGKSVTAQTALKEIPLQVAPITVMFNFPPALQAVVKEKAQAIAAAEPDGMGAAFAIAMQDMKRMALGISMVDALTVRLAAALGSDADAEQLSGLMSSAVLPMAQIWLAMTSGGKPMELAKSLKVEASPGGVATLQFHITEGDIAILEQAAKREAERAAQRMQMHEMPIEME